MFGKLVWRRSGDEIKFSPTSPDLLMYYVATLNSTNANNFKLKSSQFNPEQISKFAKVMQSIEKVSDKIPFGIDEWTGNSFDQEFLNRLHRQWVLAGIRYPALPSLLRQMGNLDKDYRDINALLHRIESSFVYDFFNYELDPYQIDNIFGATILGFDRPNISIGFDNLGRSSWEKFCNLDNNVDDSDTNDFKKLSGLIQFNLGRPLSGCAPPEYIEWCKLYNVPVVGRTLSLGNIVDLTSKLTDLREIVVRNVNEQDDQFFFEICTK